MIFKKASYDPFNNFPKKKMNGIFTSGTHLLHYIDNGPFIPTYFC